MKNTADSPSENITQSFVHGSGLKPNEIIPQNFLNKRGPGLNNKIQDTFDCEDTLEKSDAFLQTATFKPNELKTQLEELEISPELDKLCQIRPKKGDACECDFEGT